MLRQAAVVLTRTFIKNDVVNKEEEDVYIYGCELLLSELLCVSLVLALGLLTEKGMETMLYLIVYTSLRVYAGGYHACTHRNCIAVFTFAYLFLFSFVSWNIAENTLHWVLASLLAADVVMLLLAPVEDQNKPLKHEEKAYYKSKVKTRLFLFNVLIFSLYLLFPGLRDEMAYMAGAICEAAAFLLAGYIKNRKNNIALNS